MKFLIGFLTALIVVILAGLGIIYSGAYNVAASAPHFGIVSWAFHTTKHSSVEQRAAGITPPDGYSQDQVREGAHHFSETCVRCHGGPGVEPAAWARGLRPEPPNLGETARHWRPSQLFWIVKHGIKMTGMPAFGKSHEDQELWGIVAFLEKLPELSPEQYRAMAGKSDKPAPQPQGEQPAQHRH